MTIARNGNTRLEERPLAEDLRRSRTEAQALGGEVAEIAADARFLLQKEAQLARAEMAESMDRAKRALIWGGIAAFLAVPLAIFGFATLMYALDSALETWAAAGITALVVFALMALAGAIAYSQIKRMSVKPERTVHSLQEDIEWARMRIRSTGR
jgi:uncharacterized membrane protein YqjE